MEKILKDLLGVLLIFVIFGGTGFACARILGCGAAWRTEACQKSCEPFIADSGYHECICDLTHKRGAQ